jgi:hypothetical protein
MCFDLYHCKLTTSFCVLIIIQSFHGPCSALASLLGFINLIRHVVGLLWTSDQIVAKSSADRGQHNI